MRSSVALPALSLLMLTAVAGCAKPQSGHYGSAARTGELVHLAGNANVPISAVTMPVRED